MKKTLITVAFLSAFYVSKGQTNVQKTEDVSNKPMFLEKPNNAVKVKNTEGYGATQTTVAKSDYNNWEAKILQELVIDYIPKDFPVYQSSMTDEQYKSAIMIWAKENPTYLKQPK